MCCTRSILICDIVEMSKKKKPSNTVKKKEREVPKKTKATAGTGSSAACGGKRIEPEVPAVSDSGYLLALRILFAASLFVVGLYYEISCAAVSAACTMLLLWRLKKTGGIRVPYNLSLVAVLLIWLFYLLSAFWGTDSGLALWGAVKYLPLPLFALCLVQTDAQGRNQILCDIPLIGAAMTLVSFVLQYVDAWNSFFSVNSRLAGFFGYPNTFACFLLIGVLVLLTQEKRVGRRALAPVCGALLLFGLLEAGSRTIYVFALPAIAAALFVRFRRGKASAEEEIQQTSAKGKENRAAPEVKNQLETVQRKEYWASAKKSEQQKSGAAFENPRGYGLLGLLLPVVCAVLLSALSSVFGTGSAAERISEISVSTSTLLGRILYWKDALPVIAKHPFGLGYLGYYFTQGTFQTGVYSVRWVHNDLLQLLLDVGWIPAAAAVAAAGKGLFTKHAQAGQRLILFVLLAHCMVDFDLEFVAMYFVLLLCLDWEAAKTGAWKKPAAVWLPAAAGVLSALGVWIGLSASLTYAGNDSLAAAVYPWNTLSNLELLTQTTDAQELDELADQILEQNESAALAWDAKALYAYSQGDFGSFISYKKEAIASSRYSIDEYEDYFEKLVIGVELYTQAGDTYSANVCLEEIENIQSMLEELESETSALAFRLDDTPVFVMPDEYYAYLE